MLRVGVRRIVAHLDVAPVGTVAGEAFLVFRRHFGKRRRAVLACHLAPRLAEVERVRLGALDHALPDRDAVLAAGGMVEELGIRQPARLHEGLERDELVAALAVPPLAVGLVAGGVRVGAIVPELRAGDGIGRLRVVEVDRPLREAHRHAAARPDPGAEEVAAVLELEDRQVHQVLQVDERLRERHVRHGVVDVGLVGEEILERFVLRALERPGLVFRVVAEAAAVVPGRGAVATAAVVFVDRQEIVALGRHRVDEILVVVGAPAPAAVPAPGLQVAELEQVLRPGVHREHRHQARLADVPVRRRREGVEAVAVAHLLAARHVAARGVAGRVVDLGLRGVVVVDAVELDRAHREADRVRRLVLRDEDERDIEAVGRERDARSAVVLRRLLEREHDLHELLPLVRERHGDGLVARRDGHPRRHRHADREARVVAVARAHREVEKRDRARGVVRVVDDEHVGIVVDEPLAFADAPRDVGAGALALRGLLVPHVVHHARGGAEDVRDVASPDRVVAESVGRCRAVDGVDERDGAEVLEAGDDAARGGKREGDQERK